MREASEDICTYIGDQVFKSTKSREREVNHKCRKDGRYRLGGSFMKTDGNGNDTRGHRSRVKEAENIEH
eukprot:4323526-Heterocapsa_arctica.AAC.1